MSFLVIHIIIKFNKTHTKPFYGSLDFVWDNPDEPVPEETFTHSHLSWSSIIPYLLPPSIMIHGILSVQFTCLTVFFLMLVTHSQESCTWKLCKFLVQETCIIFVWKFLVQETYKS